MMYGTDETYGCTTQMQSSSGYKTEAIKIQVESYYKQTNRCVHTNEIFQFIGITDSAEYKDIEILMSSSLQV